MPTLQTQLETITKVILSVLITWSSMGLVLTLFSGGMPIALLIAIKILGNPFKKISEAWPSRGKKAPYGVQIISPSPSSVASLH